MVNNDQLLEQLNKRFDVIEKNMATKADIQPLKQGQAQTNTTLGQIKTVVETLEAGQKDIREQLATKADKADILTVGVKIDKLRKRVEGIEEDTGSTTRHKN